MGLLSPRIERMYSAVRESAELPILVQTRTAPTAAILDAARAAGAKIRFVSKVGIGYGAMATFDAAKRVAALPDTVQVFPDEPVAAFGGIQNGGTK